MLGRFIVLALAAALALGACGGDGNEDASDGREGGSGSGANSTTTTGAEQRRADAPIAQAGLLKLSDLPSGWTAKDDDSEDSSEAQCQAIIDAKGAVSARESTPTFENNDDNQLEQAVYVFPDVAIAVRSFGEIASSETRTCLRDAFVDELDEDSEEAEIGEIESAELNVDRVGDETAASRFTIPVTTPEIELEIDVTVDLVIVRTGRAVSFFTFVSILTDFDEALRAELIELADQRLERALAG